MRAVKALTAGLFLSAAIYAVTVGIERGLMHSHVNPWFLCPMLANLPVCGILFVFHMRWTAAIVYGLATAAGCAAAVLGLGPESNLMVAAPVVSAAAVAVVAIRIALRSAVVHEETVWL